MTVSASGPEAPLPAPKVDPESLVLRGRPRPIVRFRRSLIIGLSGGMTLVLVVLAWTALEPPTFRLVASEEVGERVGTPPADALAGAPADYGDVPRLGPPLPGDLGRPILKHRQESDALPPATDEAPQDRDTQADLERQRLAAAAEAARASDVLVPRTGRHGNTAASAERAPEVSQATPPAGRSPADGASSEGRDHLIANGVQPPSSPWTLSAGTIIAASLLTGLNSELPGMVVAQVTENVSDSATGRTVLVPQGARLIGRYDSQVAHGQHRALLVWERIVFPNGASVGLDRMPASDLAGYAGVADRVDSHGWQLLRGIVLSTLLGVGTELSLGSSESELVRAVRESTQQNAARAGDRIVSRDLGIRPTLTVRPGWPVRALLHKDLVLEPWKD